MNDVVNSWAVDNLKMTVILLSVFDDILKSVILITLLKRVLGNKMKLAWRFPSRIATWECAQGCQMI